MAPSILNIPVEIRLLIFRTTMGCPRIHVFDGGSAICLSPQTVCRGTKCCNDHQSVPGNEDSNVHFGLLSGLSVTCRQLYDELRTTVYAETEFSFLPGHTFSGSVNPSALIDLKANPYLRNMRSVHLEMGPAKHADTRTNAANKRVLGTLLNEAQLLDTLTLTFGYYYEASSDVILISTRTLRLLLRFRGLSSLRIRICDHPPGPHGDFHLDWVVSRVESRMQCLEEVLTRYICREGRDKQHHALDSQSIVAMSTLKAAVIAAVCEKEKDKS